MSQSADLHQQKRGGVLAWIERTGNALPDPVFIFLWLIAFLVAISVGLAAIGLSAPHPTQVDANGDPMIISAASLLSADNIQKLWVEMPTTFTYFPPLGYVLVVMLGAGVAERSGLFATAMRAGVRDAPKVILTPVIVFVAMMGNLAADAAYVVLIPLAGLLFAAVGRHPVAGIAAAFAAVSGGFSANLLPGQLDALLFGITEAASEALVPTWDANIAGNWFFIAAMLCVFLPVIWFVTDKIIEPRLGPWTGGLSGDGEADAGEVDAPITPEEFKGLRWAGLACLAVIGLWIFMTVGPGTPLINEDAKPEARLSPFYQSLVAAFFLLFIAAGWAYGAAAGTVKDHHDIVRMMSESMAALSYYLVLAFAAAHFVAMFNWSNLGLIFAVNGAAFIEAANLPIPITLGLIVLLTGLTNLFVGSASAKWALLAPVLVPMLMILGVSPEMTTAAYRVGDSATNIITPLMVYFPLILTFCQKWDKNFGLGSLAAIMLPYSLYLMAFGLVMTVGWAALDLPLGFGVPVSYTLPSGQ